MDAGADQGEGEGGVIKIKTMKIKCEKYQLVNAHLPGEGQYIFGHQSGDSIVVYQAYKPSIADYAVRQQVFGGSEYGLNRMSWIKPNFLWMMYRCGWAEKEHQERVLAIWIKKAVLEEILDNAVLSSFDPRYYTDRAAWQEALLAKDVRMQWDPDHGPDGSKLARRAIQLGIKGETLRKFAQTQIDLIEDITEFVKEQKKHLDEGMTDLLVVPIETVWDLENEQLKKRIGITEVSHGYKG